MRLTQFFAVTMGAAVLVQPAAGQDPVADAAAAAGFRGQVLIRLGDDVVYERAFGATTPDGDAPIDEHTLFYIGSIAKPITSTVALRLDADGVVTLDSTLAAHFEGVPEDKAGVTIRQLLSHTAGFPANHPDPLEALDREAFVAWALAQPLEFEPGSDWAYSNVGYALLAAAIEQTTETPFIEVVRSRVFMPAGMTSAYFVDDPALPAERLAIGEGPMAVRYGLTGDPSSYGGTWLRMGAGGIVASARDLAAFDLALRGGVLLTDAQLAVATTEVAGDYGLGWLLRETAQGTPVHWHAGGFPGFNAEFFRLPVEDGSFVVLSCVEEGAGRIRGVVAAYAGEMLERSRAE
jgi:CubicO group peptidase (beta-lactamase class C family)